VSKSEGFIRSREDAAPVLVRNTADARVSTLRRHALDIIVFAGILIVRLARLPAPFTGDQALNMLMGRVVANGGAPYVDLWDLKHPGIWHAAVETVPLAAERWRPDRDPDHHHADVADADPHELPHVHRPAIAATRPSLPWDRSRTVRLVGWVQLGSIRLEEQAARIVGTAVGLALLWVTLSGFVVVLFPSVKEAVGGGPSYDKYPLSGLATSHISVLSEDPYVPLSLGQVPVVLDPFMLPRLADKRPDAIPDLIRRMEIQEFNVVVLVEPLEPIDRSWWTEEDLGIDVVRATSRAYTYAGRMQGYYLYEPRRAGTEG
jgi:hypothetical protein